MSQPTIRARRDALGLTQKTAAELAGVTEPTWQRFEALPIVKPCPTIEDHLKNCGGAKVCPACHHPWL